VENAPLQPDTIYTEAIPLRRDGGFGVFKGGINVFYSGAHRTLNHDRRVPGGILISVNSPGHLANSLVSRGMVSSIPRSARSPDVFASCEPRSASRRRSWAAGPT
jgi:hypothetical protein